MGAGVALTVSDTNQQISAHQVLKPVTTIRVGKPTTSENRTKMDTIYEVNELESKKTSNYVPSTKQEVKQSQIYANNKIQVKKQPQQKEKDIPTQIVKQKNEVPAQQKIEQSLQVVKQKQIPIKNLEQEKNGQASNIQKNNIFEKTEGQISMKNTQKPQICQKKNSPPVKDLKIEVQPAKSKNIPVVQKQVIAQTKPNNQEIIEIKSNSNSLQIIKKREELKPNINGREKDNQKNIVSPKKIIQTAQKTNEKIKQEKKNIPIKQKAAPIKKSEPKDNVKKLIPSIDRQKIKQQKPIKSKQQLKKEQQNKAAPKQSDKSALNPIKINDYSSSKIPSSTSKNTLKDVSQHLKRQNSIIDTNIINETKDKKENNIPTNQQIYINQNSRVDKKQRKNMVPIDSLFICTEAFNSVQLEKTPNKEDKPQVARPQSKKKTIKMSRDGLRKGLTITDKENDLLLETTQKIEKDWPKETSKNIQERYSNKNLASMKSLAEAKVEQKKKKKLQTQKVEELNRKIMLQDKKNRKKQTKALKKIYNV